MLSHVLQRWFHLHFAPFPFSPCCSARKAIASRHSDAHALIKDVPLEVFMARDCHACRAIHGVRTRAFFPVSLEGFWPWGNAGVLGRSLLRVQRFMARFEAVRRRTENQSF